MVLIRWDELPDDLKTKEVKKYYEVLNSKKGSLFLKRVFDIVLSSIMLVFLAPVFLLISIAIKCDSKGKVMFRQVRITQYGKKFRIYKFRTMVSNAEKLGMEITKNNDTRITKVGRILRGLRLDEMPQLMNVLIGDMSFVGTRPEVIKYVREYTDEMKATLLLPAGITSEASIEYKNEAKLLANTDDIHNTYVYKILPEKMKYNLNSIKSYSFFKDMKIMIKTVFAVLK